MKLAHWFFIVVILLTTAACNDKKTEPPQSLYKEAHRSGQNEIGFFKYQPKNHKGNTGPTVIIDRPLLAQHIAYLVTVLPQVEEATTLVTDDHVFIGIKQKKKHGNTISVVQKTAESVTPRYFKIHVTDHAMLEARMNNIGIRMRGTTGVEGIKGDLEELLRDLGDKNPPNVNESIQPNSRKDVNPDEK